MIRRATTAATRCYLAALTAWAVGHVTASDEYFAGLFLLNAAAPWLFVPACAAAGLAVLQGRRLLGGGCFAAGVLATWLFVGPFLPKPQAGTPQGPTLRAMTYNVGAWNRHPDRVVAAVRASGADVVGLFELQPNVAAALRDDLHDEYPYQVLLPDDAGIHGIGALSRLPLRPLPARLGADWAGTPQAFSLEWRQRDVLWINAHAHSPGVAITAWRNRGSIPTAWQWLSERRQEEVQALQDFAQQHPARLVVTTDLNITPYNTSYATATADLQDAWRVAGHGWGHTWSFLRRQLGVPVWLVRIDYVLCSRDWVVQSAALGPWDGISDHRPVVADLAFAR